MAGAMLGIKFLIFVGMMVVVVGMLGAVLVAGVYQVVRDKIRESRQRDGVARDEPRPSPGPPVVGPRLP